MSILDRIEGPQDLKTLSAAELARLAAECRRAIVDVISKRGGHLASNLGVVELTLALHRRFDSPKDKLVFDTSNQCYTHKLMTGRRHRFAGIRTEGGLSGFAEPQESPHDSLAAGHAGTGLSFALGIALALQEDPGAPFTVAVVGDGALTSGTSYEALNNIVHHRPRRLVVVFNDNGWSISENVGWLAGWRRRLNRGKARAAAVWQELGFTYLGPVDGHDLGALEAALDRAKTLAASGAPVLVHALTEKGRGFAAAEQDPVKFHQPTTPSAGAGRLTYSRAFAQTLIGLMESDSRVVGITAAMLEGTALGEVRRRFPKRVFDVGIAEAHAVTMAAGLARAGWRPVVSIYSTFLQRSFDQILHDVCLQSLPVTLCIDRAGLVGDDGKTHQGLFDVAYTRPIPNLVVAAPKDENELQRLLVTAVYSGRPFALRYPRGLGTGVPLDAAPRELEIGRAETLRSGADATLLAYGAMVPPALAAADALALSGISCGVVNARFAKPLDAEALRRAAEASPRLLTVEEHVLAGGFGAAVLEAGAALGLPLRVRCHGARDRFVEHAAQAAQRRQLGLDAEGIAQALLEQFPELAGGADAALPASRDGESEAVVW